VSHAICGSHAIILNGMVCSTALAQRSRNKNLKGKRSHSAARHFYWEEKHENL
jgi:hypothetical protein